MSLGRKVIFLAVAAWLGLLLRAFHDSTSEGNLGAQSSFSSSSRSSSSRSFSSRSFSIEEFYPHYPSLVKRQKSDIDFMTPQTCGGCHPDKLKEWTASMHAMAFRDPIYQGELNAAMQAVGPKLVKQCEGCHSPAAMTKGETKGPGLKGTSRLARAGVSCDVCHSVSGHTHWQTPTHQPGNGSIVLSPGRKTDKGDVRTKYGPFEPSEGCGASFHDCVESPLHLKGELCASCHNVFHYKNHIPLEATYYEWKSGPYAAKDIHCQDCHMVDIQTFKRSADKFVRPKRSEYRHYFNGANFLLYRFAELAAKKAGDKKRADNARHKYKMARARLQAAADIELVPIHGQGETTELRIRVKNIRAGHNLPTSLTNIRQVWLEVTVRDSDGETIMSTGTLGPKGGLPEHVRLFNSRGQDNHFDFTVHPWEITSFAKHDTIPPKGYKDVYYGLPVSVAEEKLSVRVRLRYRQAGQKLAEKLLGLVPEDIHLEAIYGIKEIPRLPVIDMVDKEFRLDLSSR